MNKYIDLLTKIREKQNFDSEMISGVLKEINEYQLSVLTQIMKIMRVMP